MLHGKAVSMVRGVRFCVVGFLALCVLLWGTTVAARPSGPEQNHQPRGFDTNRFTASYYDWADLAPSSFLFTAPYTSPISFYLACWGELYPYEGCKLIDQLTDGGYYSVQWRSRLMVPSSGEYVFYLAQVDDGARLFLDGVPIIDQGWNYPDRDVRPSPQGLHLESGWHEIRIDYEQRPPFIASLSVEWQGPTFGRELIPLAPRAMTGVDLTSVLYDAPGAGQQVAPGEKLVFHINYRVPNTRPKPAVTSVRLRASGPDVIYSFEAAPSEFRRATWTVPDNVHPGIYTLTATLNWRATDGSNVTGSDSTFTPIAFPGPGPAQFTVYQVLENFQTTPMRQAGVAPKTVDPLATLGDARIGVIVDDAIHFHADVAPGLALKDKDYKWRLTGRGRQKVGRGPEFRAEFDVPPGFYTASLRSLGAERRAQIEVVEVPPPNQLLWAARLANVRAAIRANALFHEARDWAIANQGRLGGGLHNGRADAARHAYWSALTTMIIGRQKSEEAGTAHERTNFENGDPHNESVMDLSNNAAGRAAGASLMAAAGLSPLLAGRPSRGQRAAAAAAPDREEIEAELRELLQTEPLQSMREDLQEEIMRMLDAGELMILDNLGNAHERGLLIPSDSEVP